MVELPGAGHHLHIGLSSTKLFIKTSLNISLLSGSFYNFML